MGGRGKGARVSDFYTKNPNLKKMGGGVQGMWGGGCGGLDLVNLFYYESKFKIKKDLFFFFLGGGGAAGGGGYL